MPSPVRALIRTALSRTARVVIAALGLLVMHGGLGQATSCAGMTGSGDVSISAAATAVADGPPVPVRVVVPSRTGGGVEHHRPGHAPAVLHGTSMCVATPAAVGGQTRSASSDAVDLPSPAGLLGSSSAVRERDVGGREPPAPDLVRSLCVQRV